MSPARARHVGAGVQAGEPPQSVRRHLVGGERLMQRAGIVAPVKGAHVLRHTAATEMLRHGVPLEKIG